MVPSLYLFWFSFVCMVPSLYFSLCAWSLIQFFLNKGWNNSPSSRFSRRKGWNHIIPKTAEHLEKAIFSRNYPLAEEKVFCGKTDVCKATTYGFAAVTTICLGQLLIKRFSPIFIYFSKVGMNFFTPAQQIQILWVKAAKPWCLIFSWTGSTRSKVPTSPLDWSSPHLSLDSSSRHLISQLLQCKTGPVTGPALSFVNITTNATHSSVRVRQMPRIHLCESGKCREFICGFFAKIS